MPSHEQVERGLLDSMVNYSNLRPLDYESSLFVISGVQQFSAYLWFCLCLVPCRRCASQVCQHGLQVP